MIPRATCISSIPTIHTYEIGYTISKIHPLYRDSDRACWLVEPIADRHSIAPTPVSLLLSSPPSEPSVLGPRVAVPTKQQRDARYMAPARRSVQSFQPGIRWTCRDARILEVLLSGPVQ